MNCNYSFIINKGNNRTYKCDVNLNNFNACPIQLLYILHYTMPTCISFLRCLTWFVNKATLIFLLYVKVRGDKIILIINTDMQSRNAVTAHL